MSKFLAFSYAVMITIVVSVIIIWRKYLNKYEEDFEHEKDEKTKFIKYYDLFTRWIELDQKDKGLKRYFEENNYSKVAVYGMKEAGVLLYNALDSSGMDAVYAIDKSPERLNLNIPIIKPSEGIPDVDVVVVTPVYYFDTIKTEIGDLTNADIVSLEDVVWGI